MKPLLNIRDQVLPYCRISDIGRYDLWCESMCISRDSHVTFGYWQWRLLSARRVDVNGAASGVRFLEEHVTMGLTNVVFE